MNHDQNNNVNIKDGLAGCSIFGYFLAGLLLVLVILYGWNISGDSFFEYFLDFF